MVPQTMLTSRPNRKLSCMNGCCEALRKRKSSLQAARSQALARMPWAALASTI